MCPQCGSCLVPMADLEVAMRAMGNRSGVFLPRAWSAGAPRGCPRCSAAMATCTLLDVTVDRCDTHGVWFDRDELARALYAAAPQKPENEIGVLGAAGGVIDGVGTLLEILEIFLP